MKSPPITGKAQLIRNALFQSGGWGINIVVTFLFTPYFVYKLTAEGYGIFALLTGLVGYYSVMDLGLGDGVIKFVAQYMVTKNYKAINYSINAALLVQLVMGTIASVVLIVFADPLLATLRVSPEYLEAAKLSLYACAVGFFFQMLAGTFTSAVRGIQRYDLSSKVSVSVEVFKNVAIALMLFLGYGLLAVIGMVVIATILTFFANVYVLKKELPTWTLLDGTNFKYFKKLFGFSGFVFITNISFLFRNYIVRFVISYFLGPAAVTYYVIPSKLVNAVQVLLSSGFTIIFPYASELGARGETEKLKNAWLTGSRLLVAFSIPLYLTIIIFSRPIMTLWMGSTVAENTWVALILLAVLSLLGSLTLVSIKIALGLGHARIQSYFALATIVLYMILLVPLTSQFGIIGAIISMIICNNLPSLVFVAYVARNFMHSSMWQYLVHVTSFHIIPVLVAAGLVLFGVTARFPATLWILLIAGLMVAVYFMMMVVLKWVPQFLSQSAQKRLGLIK